MPSDDDIAWFKGEFGPAIEAAVAGTPFTVDMLTAIACQETGSIWSVLRKKGLPKEKIVELCVGDTLDGRSVFPKDKAELLTHPQGAAMFKVANEALKAMAAFIPGFKGVAGNPNKFCHGYGVFQRDIQFFKNDPDYFLQRKWATFEGTLAKAIENLKEAMKAPGVGLAGKTKLTDMEMARVAIAYNTGRFRPEKGLKQGHKDPSGFYGENFLKFLQRAHAIAPAGPPTGQTPDQVAGTAFKVATSGDPLLLRSAPKKESANVMAKLPNGHAVTALGPPGASGFVNVRTRLGGKTLTGFAAAAFLRPA